jgi:hypothetical protein
MKTIKSVLILFISLFLANKSSAQDHLMADTSRHIINVSDMKWVDGPEGLPKGAKLAVLEGNPAEPGAFTIRLMFPADYMIGPHWHPTSEHVSVIEGTLFLGMDESGSKQTASRLSQGGFAAMPAKMVHYAFTIAPVTIQVHAIGPFAITYIKDSDDPRKKPQP